MVFLKPRIAPWRYQRGSRSLVANLAASQGSKEPEKNIVQQEDVDDEDDDDVAEQVEVVIEEVLNALRDQNREVQYVSCAAHYQREILIAYDFQVFSGQRNRQIDKSPISVLRRPSCRVDFGLVLLEGIRYGLARRLPRIS